MERGFQLVPFVLRQPTYTASGNDVVTLESLPETSLGRIAHLAGISFDCILTPTLTTPPTLVTQLNSFVNRLEFNDGQQPRFQGSFNVMRNFEILENGRLRTPDPDAGGASATPVYVRRYLPIGPWCLAGNPSDFLLPCAALKGGRLEFNFGALTDYSADTTAISLTMRITAWLAFLDKEVRVPPFYERNTYQVSNADASLPGRALYVVGGLQDALLPAAITAGDFNSIIVSTGSGELPSVTAQSYEAAFHAQMDSGHLTQAHGEPAAATDDNPKIVNAGTPTALVGALANIQPWAWSPKGTRISKLALMAESALRVRWPAGTQATGTILYGRLLAQSPEARAALAARALQKLGMRDTKAKVKTLSKEEYKGPRDEFMPMAVKVG